MVSPLEHPLLHGVQVVAPLLGSRLGPCIINMMHLTGIARRTRNEEQHGAFTGTWAH